jgi:mono/diheme cytochrome c family protein
MKLKILYILVAAIAAFAAWKWLNPSSQSTGGSLAQVKVPTLSAIAQRGNSMFDKNCATCHGKNAAGIDGSGPPLIHKIYEPGHHGDQAFLLAARRGVRSHHWKFGNMPAVENISDDEIGQIVIYIREVQRANDIF